MRFVFGFQMGCGVGRRGVLPTRVAEVRLIWALKSLVRTREM